MALREIEAASTSPDRLSPSPVGLASPVAGDPSSRPHRVGPIPGAPRRLRALWIDDEVRPDDALVRLLQDEGIVGDIAGTGAEGLARAQSGRYDAILVDLRLPDMYGLTVLQRLVASRVDSAVLLATAYYLEPEIKVEARRLGGAGVLHKPFLEVGRLAAAIRAAVDGELPGQVSPVQDPPFGIVAASQAMQDVMVWVGSVAHSNLPVLLTGETGAGKELVARAIHEAGPRHRRPFVPVNCAAIPELLFESELFGHKKGAFTGASENTSGLIAAADGGTLFLDEVAEMPTPIQPRLLRCLEDRHVRRIGETGERVVDVRVIAATNRRLCKEVGRSRFRQDLYFRLSGASRDIPPLRERREDIAPLTRHWLSQLSRARAGVSLAIDPQAMRLLELYEWPGNVRELRNVLEHALCLATGPVVTERDIAAALRRTAPDAHQTPDAPTKAHVLAELEAHHWNRTETARALKIGRTTLWRWLRNDEPGAGHD